MTNLVEQYHGVDYSLHVAGQYARAAKESLKDVVPSPEKEALLAMADYVVGRRW